MTARMGSGKLEEYKNGIATALQDNTKPWTKFFEMVEEKTGISRLNAFLGCAAFIALYLVFGWGAQLLCNIIGVAYPAYVSIHAIESSPKTDDTKWLIYWVTFAILSLIEHFSFFLCKVIPFYWLIKCTFLIWCMLPIPSNGSIMIYNRIVRPYFLKHHEAADRAIDEVFDKVKHSVGVFAKKAE